MEVIKRGEGLHQVRRGCGRVIRLFDGRGQRSLFLRIARWQLCLGRVEAFQARPAGFLPSGQTPQDLGVYFQSRRILTWYRS